MSENRLHHVEALRAIAALYVVVGHVANLIDPYNKLSLAGASPRWLALVTIPFRFGHLAVAAFIVISGFCLQLAQDQRGDPGLTDWKPYLFRRARRILPPYYACLALSLVVVYFFTSRQTAMPFTQYIPVTTGALLSHVFLVHNLRPEWMYKINGVLWSIAIEFQIYFLFPILAKLRVRFNEYVPILVAGVFATFLLLTVPNALKLYFWYVPLFALGMLAAKNQFLQRSIFPALTLLLVVGSVARDKNLIWSDVNVGIFTAWALAYWQIARRPLAVVQPLVRGLAQIGGFSYSLYLIHHPLLQILYLTRPEFARDRASGFAYLALIGIPTVVALAYGFYWLFERPFMRSKPREVSPPVNSFDSAQVAENTTRI